MTNPNPFVPKGSLLEQQSKSRSQFKWAVSGILAVSVIGLVAILIQGCKREAPVGDSGSTDLSSLNASNTPADMSSSNSADIYSNATPTYATMPPSNTMSAPNQPISAIPSQPPQQPVSAIPANPVDNSGATTEYTVVSGDTLGKIAHAHGVSLKALEAANPGVDPKKLHPKQKLNIPAGGGSASAASPADMSGSSVDSGETYVVKSGDNLMKIAKKYHVKVKALQAANNLTTTQIRVGQKLKIPASAESAPAAPVVDTGVAPVTPPAPPAPSMPAPSTPAPTTAH
jgi:LysM repeat protein